VRIWQPLIIVVVAGACVHARPHSPSPADREWSVTLDSAQRLAADSQYPAADSLLASYAQRTPGSLGAREAIFWTGVFALAERNTRENVHAARLAFETYLADTAAVAHRAEAAALSQATRTIDSLSQARAADSVPAVHLVVSDDSLRASAREQEMAKSVKRLQDSLDKTTAELDRIKKRLSTGKP
jgi:hypothetical protein